MAIANRNQFGTAVPVIPAMEQIGAPVRHRDKIDTYYDEAGADYATWSRKFNMHFGYYRAGVNPFKLEDMLDRMNDEVLDRLDLGSVQNATLLDMGCGVGASMRHAARRFCDASITGVTIVKSQIQRARALTPPDLESRAHYQHADYLDVPAAAKSFDGIFALESACYAPGIDKIDLMREIFRLLKPGRRFVVVDGFLKKPAPTTGILGCVYREICTCWALDTFAELGGFAEGLRRAGFDDVHIEDASYRIAPSVLHIPLKVIRFFTCDLIRSRKHLTRERWHNVLAPLLGIVLGLARHQFGYYIITGRKPD